MARDGTIIWHELLTGDVGAAATYYAQLIGWTARPVTCGAQDFTVLHAGADPIAAVIGEPERSTGDSWRNEWVCYVDVADVDAVMAHALRLGGTARVEPVSVDGIGRFAIVIDPLGAAIGLFAPEPEGGAEPPHDPQHVGGIAWHELYADDHDSATAFYAGLFGWTCEAIGHDQTNHSVTLANRGEPVSVIRRRPSGMRHCLWVPFATVDRIDIATSKLREMGGNVLGATGAAAAVRCRDPHGAMFGLAARR